LQQQEINALKKACFYSFPPNKLGYCGPDESWKTFDIFVSGQSNEKSQEVKFLLEKFYGLHNYLEAIARANSLDPFDKEVIEAYWIGNRLLEKVSFEETQNAIISLQKHGLPKKIAEKKAAKLPRGMIPHHSMHVLYVNFITSKLEPIVKNLSSCIVQWAKVEKNRGDTIAIKGIELFSEANELKIREKEKIVENPFGVKAEKGFVSTHWGRAIEEISEEEMKNLKKYTIKTVELMNK